MTWRSDARARLADRDKPLAPDEGIATAQAEWEGDLYVIATRALDALDAVLALPPFVERERTEQVLTPSGDVSSRFSTKTPLTDWEAGYNAALDAAVRAIEGEPA